MLPKGAHNIALRQSYLRSQWISWRPTATFSTTSKQQSYEDTIQHLKVTSETKVVVQGFTGKQATVDSKQTLEYGTKIVGGVRPGKEGEHLGLPYLPSMRAVKEQLNPDATLVYVAAAHAAGAIEEAIEAEIPLIVAVAEHIPLHDMLRVQAMLRSQSKSRLVGANSPGMTSTHARCRLGFQPLPFFKEGNISIVAKSGTLSYETVASTTKSGLGQSYVIGMGGDPLPGTDFVDALKILEHDENTEGIIIVGEVGGFAEEKAADWIRDYRKRVENPKPIMALIGGLQAVPGRVMGHDGAFAAPGEGNAQSKVKALESVGVIMTDHPSKFGEAMKGLLSRRLASTSPASISGQRSSMHTLRRRPQPQSPPITPYQKRTLSLSHSQGLTLLKDRGIPVSSDPSPSNRFAITVGVNRTFYRPYLHIQRPPSTPISSGLDSAKILYQLDGTPETFHESILPAVGQFATDPAAKEALTRILHGLALLYLEKEGSWFHVEVGGSGDGDELSVVAADLKFDDWAFAMSKRHPDIHALRDVQTEVQEEVEAEKDGIVYIRLPGPGAVGTLVNGAGLAMNTTDALALAGHPAANFLDTGGKATAATVQASFRAVLGDPRVRAVFVNIFGGLTRCEMIAEGIVGAYKEEGIRVPVVVRLRGTNEEEGRVVLRESGLDLVAVEDFAEGVRKVGEAVERGVGGA